MIKAIYKFFVSSKRILSISQKPTPKEYWIMAKIIGLGMIIIGIIGYIIKYIFNLISGSI